MKDMLDLRGFYEGRVCGKGYVLNVEVESRNGILHVKEWWT